MSTIFSKSSDLLVSFLTDVKACIVGTTSLEAVV